MEIKCIKCEKEFTTKDRRVIVDIFCLENRKLKKIARRNLTWCPYCGVMDTDYE